MKNVLKLNYLAKSVFMPSGLIAAASTTDVAIYKKVLGPATIMNDIMKIVKSLEEIFFINKRCLLIHGICKTIRNEAKEQTEYFTVCY